MKLPVDASQVAWEPGWKMEWARRLLFPVASATQERISVSLPAAEGRVVRLQTRPS